MAESAPAPTTEQLNLKVKSQVLIYLYRTVKRSFSKSKAPLNSKNSWMPIVRDKAYLSLYSAQRHQCSFPLWWTETSWEPDPERPQHGERRWNRCRDLASRRFTSRMMLLNSLFDKYSFKHYHSSCMSSIEDSSWTFCKTYSTFFCLFLFDC